MAGKSPTVSTCIADPNEVSPASPVSEALEPGGVAGTSCATCEAVEAAIDGADVADNIALTVGALMQFDISKDLKT
jgi:hypothetical protein